MRDNIEHILTRKLSKKGINRIVLYFVKHRNIL